MRSIISVFILLLSACGPDMQLRTVPLRSLQGNTTTIDPSKNALTIIYFLSPECPLCVNYSGAMKDLNQRFGNDSVRFYGVFSSEWYSTSDLEAFRSKYGLDIDLYFETENQLSTALGATVTPEVFVLDREGSVRYSGKIDNWVNQLGKKKLAVSEHYLENALIALQNGRSIDPERTEAIGCLIE
jgi:peroxiredoxin